MHFLRGGVFVTLEGIDGTGKTTQLRRLAERFARLAFPVSCYREPGMSAAGRRLREAAAKGRLDADQEHQLFMEDRREDVAANITPDLAAGRLVLLDRYYLSNMAYQGARGIAPARILAENEAFAPRPDLAIILDVPVDVAWERVRARGRGHDGFEGRDYLEQVRAQFLQFAKEYAWVRLVDARGSPAALTDELAALIEPILAAKR
ncbi:MAG: dTMP kinase [Thermoplasmatota archaeon]